MKRFKDILNEYNNTSDQQPSEQRIESKGQMVFSEFGQHIPPTKDTPPSEKSGPRILASAHTNDLQKALDLLKTLPKNPNAYMTEVPRSIIDYPTTTDGTGSKN